MPEGRWAPQSAEPNTEAAKPTPLRTFPNFFSIPILKLKNVGELYKNYEKPHIFYITFASFPKMKLLEQYLQSFQQKKILPVFLIDFFFYGLLFLLAFLYATFLRAKSSALAGIQSAEQLQQMLLSSPEQAQLFLDSLKSFMLIFVAGAIVLLAFLILGYSYTRKMVWNYLRQKKSGKFGKWILLNFVLLAVLVLYLVIVFIVRLILNYLLSLISQPAVSQFLSSLLALASLLLFLAFVFLVYCLFAGKYKVWESIGDTFSLIKTRGKELWKFFLLVLATGTIINLLLSLVPGRIGYFFAHPLAFSLLSTGLFLLFLAWMQVYLVKTMES